MKILILTDYYPPDKLGGVGEIAKNLKASFELKGHDVWVLTTGSNQDEEKVIRSSKSLIKGVILNNLRAIQLIKKYDIDIVNMHQSTTTLFLFSKYLPFLYKKFPRVVNSFQVSYFSEFSHIRQIKVRGQTFKPLRKEYIEKWILSPIHILLDWIGFVLADEVTVVSSENKKEFQNTYGKISNKRIKIIPNGINTNDFSPSNARIPEEIINKIDNKIVLLYVGVFRVRKRVFNLLFALREIVKTNKNVVLVLVGGGRGYEYDLLKLVKDLHIEKNVIFVGRIPNQEVVNYLRAADVFCLASSYEGMPIAILEAMASGKAILTSNVSGMVDLIEDGSDGYLTEVDNINQITEKLMFFANHPKKTIQMGQNARKKVMKHYDWNAISSNYIDLFRSQE